MDAAEFMGLEPTADSHRWRLPVIKEITSGMGALFGGVGLGAAVDYMTDLGMDNIREHEHELTSYALQALQRVDGETVTIDGGTLAGGGAVDCGLAGTVMRFVPPAATLADGAVVDLALRLTGSVHGRLRVRLAGAPLGDGGLSLTGSHSFVLDDYAEALEMFRKGTGRKLQIRPNDTESRVLL